MLIHSSKLSANPWLKVKWRGKSGGCFEMWKSGGEKADKFIGSVLKLQHAGDERGQAWNLSQKHISSFSPSRWIDLNFELEIISVVGLKVLGAFHAFLSVLTLVHWYVSLCMLYISYSRNPSSQETFRHACSVKHRYLLTFIFNHSRYFSNGINA